MEEKTLIKRSPYGLYVQIISFGVAALFIGLLATWLFSFLLDKTEGGGMRLIRWTWVIFIVVWLLASVKLWFDWRVKRYEIGTDMLTVHAKAGSLGSSQEVYRYESIISMRLSQNMFGKLFGYGDVYLTIPKIDQPVVMNDIEDPEHQLAALQQRLGDRSGDSTTTSLIT